MTYALKMPDYGGGGGSSFNDYTTYGSNAPVAIRAITVRAGKYVDYLQPLYVLADGTVVSVPHGGTGGSSPETLTLAPNEKLVGLKGRSGKYLDQISFVLEVANPDGTSTARTVGPYGGTGGDPFQIWGETVALYGRSGSKLDALGSYVNATPSVLCGSGGGSAFQDPVPVPGLSSIAKIAIRSATYVDAIATTYRLADGSQKTFSHGGKGGSPNEDILLAAGEKIVRVEGSTGLYLYGITFHTVDEKGGTHKYGPYGKGGGFPFSIDAGIGAFFGRSGDYIDAIGFYLA